MLELKRLEIEVNRIENILNPVLELAKKANKKLNKVSNKSLWVLNIGNMVELTEMGEVVTTMEGGSWEKMGVTN